MRKLLAGCLALCIPALLTAQTPADSISRTEAIDSVVVTARRPLMVYKQTGNIAVDIEQLKYAPLFAGTRISGSRAKKTYSNACNYFRASRPERTACRGCWYAAAATTKH